MKYERMPLRESLRNVLLSGSVPSRQESTWARLRSSCLTEPMCNAHVTSAAARNPPRTIRSGSAFGWRASHAINLSNITIRLSHSAYEPGRTGDGCVPSLLGDAGVAVGSHAHIDLAECHAAWITTRFCLVCGVNVIVPRERMRERAMSIMSRRGLLAWSILAMQHP